MIPMVKTYQTKKTRALYHACVLKYAAAKIRSFLKNGLYFGRPLYVPYTILYLCQTGRVWASQPAKGSGRSIKKKDSNIDWLYICVSVYVSYSAAMLFTCTQVRSRQLAMKGLIVKLDPLEQTARYRVGQGKQKIYLGERTNRRLSLSLDRGHEGRIHKVLYENGCSSMYKDITVCF